MSNAVLRVNHLTLKAGSRTLCRDLDIALAPGERLALAGASGTGKTRVLRCLAALDTPPGMQLEWQGKPLIPADIPAFRARHIYLSQKPALPEGSVDEALRQPFGYRIHRSRHYPDAQVLQLLSALGFTADFLDQSCSELSGGEGQAVCLVRALLLEPDVLLLDEPTSAMDPQRVAQAESLITHWLTAGPARACIWTSHDASQLARTTDRHLTLGGAG